MKFNDIYINKRPGELGTHENSKRKAGELKVCSELRTCHLPGSPSRTIWVPSPLVSCTLCKLIIFLALLLLLPCPKHVVFQALGGWNILSLLFLSTITLLPNFSKPYLFRTPSGDPTQNQSSRKLKEVTPDLQRHPPTLFLGRFSFLCAKACSIQANAPGGRLCALDTVNT